MPVTPRLCIAFPGNNCSRNTTFAVHIGNLVRHIENDFLVTLAFRSIQEPLNLECRQISILQRSQVPEEGAFFAPGDFAAVRRYLRRMDHFAHSWSNSFDYVIEKTWRLDGALTYCFSRYGIPGAPVLEGEFHLSDASENHFPRSKLQRLLWPPFRRYLVGSKRKWLSSADTIITETRQMHAWLTDQGYISQEARWEPIPAAYDGKLFYPRDREACRRELGLDQSAVVVTYVGSLNCLIHDPLPLMEAMAKQRDRNHVLCMIGDGGKRRELESFAADHGVKAVFSGRLEQSEIGRYIGASNVCAAPYDLDFYPDRRFTSGSLKVVEYLACGRPVVSIPCQRMEDLLADGKYGYLVENSVPAYRDFFREKSKPQDFLAKEQVLLKDIRSGALSRSKYVLDFGSVGRRLSKLVHDRLSTAAKTIP